MAAPTEQTEARSADAPIDSRSAPVVIPEVVATAAAAGHVEGTDDDPAPRFVPAFDGFRGVAALMIVVYHCWGIARFPGFSSGPAQALLAGSNLGVDMFFVISGFVLFLPMARTGNFGSVAAYAVRRVARIVPAYYVYILFVLVFWEHLTLPLSQFVFPLSTNDGIISVIGQLAFVQAILNGPLPRIIGYDTPYGIGPLGVTWSLTVEVSFYLVLPFVARPFFRRPLLALTIGILVSIGWRVLMSDPLAVARNLGWDPDPSIEGGLRHQLFVLLPGLAGHFAIGMGLAWFVVKASRDPRLVSWLKVPWIGTVALVGSFAAVVLTWWLWGHQVWEVTMLGDPAGAESELFAGVFSSLLFAAAFGVFAGVVVLGPRWASWPWATPAFRFLGDISYGVFLWHFVAIWFLLFTVRLEASGQTWTFFAYLLATLGIALPAAWLSRVFVEQPAIRLGRRLSRRIEQRGQSAGAAGRVAEANQW